MLLDNATQRELDRFKAKIDRQPNGCWLWLGTIDQGYAVFWFRGRTIRASRIAWELAHHATFPAGHEPHHTCEETGCVNPTHVKPKTHAEHMKLHRQGKKRDW